MMGRRYRAGFGMAMVIVAVTILALVVASMLFFSGSQTRSLAGSMNTWRARAYALAGLYAAADKLRGERWYGDQHNYEIADPSVFGIDGDIDFVVVVDDIVADKKGGPYVYNGMEVHLPVVYRIDIFSRGEFEGRSHVVYGRFIISPEPAAEGKSTEGLALVKGQGNTLAQAARTLKRLVRVCEFKGDDYRDIESQAVRDRIRSEFRTRSARFLDNYVRVDWKASPSPPAGDRTSDDQALAFLRCWSKAPEGIATNVFVRDRMYDFILPPTSPFDRAAAADRRDLRLELDPPSSAADRAFIIKCCRATGTPVEDPAQYRTEEYEHPEAMDKRHDDSGADVSAPDYIHKLVYEPRAQVKYTASWAATAVATSEARARQLTGISGGVVVEHGGVYYLGVSVQGPEWVAKPYWINDPASGLDACAIHLEDLACFWTKYFDDGGAEPIRQYVKTGGHTAPRPVGGGGGGAAGGGGSVSGGW